MPQGIGAVNGKPGSSRSNVIYTRSNAVLSSRGAGRGMIKWLRIKNIALIQEVELELAAGLTLLTGETGAGKSILVDALGLLLGRRASSELIRSGEEQAVVEGMVERPSLRRFLESHGLPADDDEIVIRREIQASGKGKATVNGALVPVALLRELGSGLVTIHGQHEPQGLLDAETHIQLVDRHAGVVTGEVADLFARLREIDAELETLRRDRREWERRREMLEFQAK